MEKRGEEVFFGKCGKPQERFDFGEHNGRTFCEVHLGNSGYCEWAFGQDSKVCQLTCFKYFLRRVGVMMARDERHREEGRGERGTENFKGGVQERAESPQKSWLWTVIENIQTKHRESGLDGNVGSGQRERYGDEGGEHEKSKSHGSIEM